MGIGEIIGSIGAFLTSVSFIPQIVHGIKTKKMDDVSTSMIMILAVGSFCWLLYGLYLSDSIIIAANSFTFSCLICILLMKIKYSNS